MPEEDELEAPVLDSALEISQKTLGLATKLVRLFNALSNYTST
jgi:hypothetical protein